VSAEDLDLLIADLEAMTGLRLERDQMAIAALLIPRGYVDYLRAKGAASDVRLASSGHPNTGNTPDAPQSRNATPVKGSSDG
jgi:hypothetical protein